jgi:Ser/Thr protein kinase RdoA (MazF antagonist)
LENNVYLLQHQGQAYALKICPPDTHPSHPHYEHWVILGLQSAALSFELPIPIRTRHDATYYQAPDGEIWTLARKLEGEWMRPNDPDQAYAVGAALAELHRALASLPSLLRPDFQHYNLDQRTLVHLRQTLPTQTAQIGLGQTPESLYRLQRFLILAEQFKSPPPYPDGNGLHWHIVHGDFFGANVLYNGEAVSGVLDFKYARPDYRVREFAETLLRVTNDLGPLFWGTARSFVEGYASILKLTRPEIDLTPRFIVEYYVDRILYYAQHQPTRAANALRVQEDISAWLEVEQSRVLAMLRGVFLGE